MSFCEFPIAGAIFWFCAGLLGAVLVIAVGFCRAFKRDMGFWPWSSPPETSSPETCHIEPEQPWPRK